MKSINSENTGKFVILQYFTRENFKLGTVETLLNTKSVQSIANHVENLIAIKAKTKCEFNLFEVVIVIRRQSRFLIVYRLEDKFERSKIFNEIYCARYHL